MRYGFVSFPAARMGWGGAWRISEKGVAEATPPRVPPLPQSMLRST